MSDEYSLLQKLADFIFNHDVDSVIAERYEDDLSWQNKELRTQWDHLLHWLKPYESKEPEPLRRMNAEERLENLINLHYEGSENSPHARSFSQGWHSAQSGYSRHDCTYSNEYHANAKYPGDFYVQCYCHWHRGYDSWEKWKGLV